VRNPSFDVTPADLITGIVTDEGVIRAPYAEGLAEAAARRELRRAQAPGFRDLWKAATDAPATAAPDDAAAADDAAAEIPAAVES
jgi:hypothetical protein